MTVTVSIKTQAHLFIHTQQLAFARTHTHTHNHTWVSLFQSKSITLKKSALAHNPIAELLT
jgi:hypothetical protein